MVRYVIEGRLKIDKAGVLIIRLLLILVFIVISTEYFPFFLLLILSCLILTQCGLVHELPPFTILLINHFVLLKICPRCSTSSHLNIWRLSIVRCHALRNDLR